MLELLKTLGFTEKYIQEVNDMFSSFQYRIDFEISDYEIQKLKNLVTKIRKRKEEGKDTSAQKAILLDKYYDYSEILFWNDYITKNDFKIDDCFRNMDIYNYNRYNLCDVPFNMELNLSRFKSSNQIDQIFSISNISITPYYDDEKFDYPLSINNTRFDTLNSKLTISGTLRYDPDCSTDCGYGAALIEEYNDHLHLELSFTLYYLPLSDSKITIPKWLEVLTKSKIYYDQKIYEDAIFNCFTALDNITEKTYTTIEDLAKKMDLKSQMSENKYAEFCQKYTGCQRRLIEEKLDCVLKIFESEAQTGLKGEFISCFRDFENPRNDIAHANDDLRIPDSDKEDFNLKDCTKQFYHKIFKLIYLFAYNDSLIDHIRLIIDFDRCDEPYSIEI